MGRRTLGIPRFDIVGKKFGKLLVLRRVMRVYLGGVRYVVRCECDNERVVRGDRLRHGETTGCRSCSHKKYGTKGKGTWEYSLWEAAACRARKNKLPFTISPNDIVIPERCPLLGTKLRHGGIKNRAASASLDQIVPGAGYTPANTWVISMKANGIKSDLTLAQFEKFIRALRKVAK
jgi:hypothetical protein